MKPSERTTPVPLLEIRDLEVSVYQAGKQIKLLDGFDLSICSSEIVGVIGETGAGKSISAWATMGLLPEAASITHGSIFWKGDDLVKADAQHLRRIRGRQISIISQNPVSALNPFLTLGDQIVRMIRAHERVSRRAALSRAIEQLQAVGFPKGAESHHSFPHQLSGGMAQRAIIAIAMISKPSLLIADEPTTGLDATLQADILDLIDELVTDSGASVWLITHDMGVVARLADKVAVMFAGQVVEESPTTTVLEKPCHPYTRGLIDALTLVTHPRLKVDGPPPDLLNRPLGCQFQYRCPWRTENCKMPVPVAKVALHQSVRCILAHREAAIPSEESLNKEF
ncbi:ABC transporter ATP-binding protein [Roseovarius sp. M141]|uniref:ABC transporter ATP-binding protein n=1 Tax=Roseovarius sp. M141 TaxID=2583806 RepID=UPI0020CCAD8A|nr:ABC transporter ATP-binding protein [Roseovarius sp. M141]MCQ0090700.1 ABC transporter ATP-binding protein [Roseovarius sp. M141]